METGRETKGGSEKKKKTAKSLAVKYSSKKDFLSGSNLLLQFSFALGGAKVT